MIIVSSDLIIDIAILKEGRTVPRKGHIVKRDVLADPLYDNKVVTKLVNTVMLDGKKGVVLEPAGLPGPMDEVNVRLILTQEKR